MLNELFDQFDVDGRRIEVSWMISRECELKDFESLVFWELRKDKGSDALLIQQCLEMHLRKVHRDASP